MRTEILVCPCASFHSFQGLERAPEILGFLVSRQRCRTFHCELHSKLHTHRRERVATSGYIFLFKSSYISIPITFLQRDERIFFFTISIYDVSWLTADHHFWFLLLRQLKMDGLMCVCSPSAVQKNLSQWLVERSMNFTSQKKEPALSSSFLFIFLNKKKKMRAIEQRLDADSDSFSLPSNKKIKGISLF